jgi:Carboxypeptidase regulatory-like domain
MRRWGVSILCALAGSFLVPAAATAQASISGAVTDTSGAVMPGVTVEVASPALIEQVRTAFTDGAGLYRITELRPGTYTVSFTLPGFSTFKREGIVLTGTFNAQVNAELRVGTLEETVTVSGASPVVDVVNTQTQTVLTKEQIEILPGSRTLKGRAALVPGVVIPGGNTGVVAHGSDSQDSHTMVDGFKSGQHLVGRGTGQIGVGSVTQTQEAAIEELVYATDSQGAEYAFSGVRMNLIPKEGSNRFSMEGIAYGSNQHFESNNLGDLQEGPNPLKYAPQLFFFDFNPVVGGPIRENKLWYFGSVSGNRSNTQILDVYFKDHPSTPPGKVGQLADTGANLNWSETVRITHQVTSRHKLRYSFDNTRSLSLRGNYGTSGTKVQPEASWRLPLYPAWLAQVKYTAPITSRLLIEGGYSYQRGDFRVQFQPQNAPTAIARWDRLTGIVDENHYLSYSNTEKKQEAKAAISYVTGSHSLKAGFEDRWASPLETISLGEILAM